MGTWNLTADIRMMTRQEIQQAITRGINFNLLGGPCAFDKPVYLARECERVEVAQIFHDAWGGMPVAGFCQVIIDDCIQNIKAYLRCNAWRTFGWVTDTARGDFWKMDPDELCRRLARGWIGLGEFHTWITLDSGELIDPVIYPTLSELFPRRFSKGKSLCNFHLPNGGAYKTTPGLPLFQYHPSVFCD